MTSIPTTASVTQAYLYLYNYTSWGEGQTSAFTIHKMTRSWNDQQATWFTYQTGTFWTSEGGDFVSASITEFTITGASGQWVKINVLTAVQSFVKDPTNNNGLFMKNTSGVRGPIFSTSETVRQEFRPKLTIVYDVSTSVHQNLKKQNTMQKKTRLGQSSFNLQGRKQVLPRSSNLLEVFEHQVHIK